MSSKLYSDWIPYRYGALLAAAEWLWLGWVPAGAPGELAVLGAALRVRQRSGGSPHIMAEVCVQLSQHSTGLGQYIQCTETRVWGQPSQSGLGLGAAFTVRQRSGAALIMRQMCGGSPHSKAEVCRQLSQQGRDLHVNSHHSEAEDWKQLLLRGRGLEAALTARQRYGGSFHSEAEVWRQLLQRGRGLGSAFTARQRSGGSSHSEAEVWRQIRGAEQ